MYSLVSSTSIATLFVAGYIPGILWALACMLVVWLYVRKRPELKNHTKVSLPVALLTLWRAVPSILMIVIVIGGILAGVFTPTESAAIAVVYCLILGFIYKAIKVGDLPRILIDATLTTAIVMLLVGVSTIMAWVMAFSGIPAAISSGLLGLTDSPTLILILIMVILLIVGTFMDPTPAILIFVPIFLPIVTTFGVDPIHFGIMVTFNLCLGTITPPVGNVLFVGATRGGPACRTGHQGIGAVLPGPGCHALCRHVHPAALHVAAGRAGAPGRVTASASTANGPMRCRNH